MNGLPPGLAGYVVAEQNAQQRGMGQIQQLGGLLGLQNAMFEQQLNPLKLQQLQTAVADANFKAGILKQYQQLATGGAGGQAIPSGTQPMLGVGGQSVPGGGQINTQTGQALPPQSIPQGGGGLQLPPQVQLGLLHPFTAPLAKVQAEMYKPTDAMREAVALGYQPGTPQFNAFIGTKFNQGGAWQIGPNGGVSLAPGYAPGMGSIEAAKEAEKARFTPFMGQVDSRNRPIAQTQLQFVQGVGGIPPAAAEQSPSPLAGRSPQEIAAINRVASGETPNARVGPRGQGMTPGERAFSDALAGDQAKAFTTAQTSAESSAKSIQTLHEARQILDQGVITGAGAEFAAGLGNWLAQAGIKMAEDPVANTQAFAATQARQVLTIIKNLGSGSGISDADREYAAKIVGGNITITEPALRRLLDIGERAARADIQQFNRKAEGVKGSAAGEAIPYSLGVEEPPQYKPRPRALPDTGGQKGGVEFNGYRFPNQEALDKYKKAAGLDKQSSIGEDILNYIVPSANAETLQKPYQIISNLHGPIGTFNSKEDAFNFAKRMGIPTSSNGLSGGYFLKQIKENK